MNLILQSFWDILCFFHKFLDQLVEVITLVEVNTLDVVNLDQMVKEWHCNHLIAAVAGTPLGSMVYLWLFVEISQVDDLGQIVAVLFLLLLVEQFVDKQYRLRLVEQLDGPEVVVVGKELLSQQLVSY